MRKRLGLLVIVGIGALLSWQLIGQESNAPRPEGWRLTPPAPGAVAVTTDTRLGGTYPVGSRLPDRKALGGFGGLGEKPAINASGNVAFLTSPTGIYVGSGGSLTPIYVSGDGKGVDLAVDGRGHAGFKSNDRDLHGSGLYELPSAVSLCLLEPAFIRR